MGTTTLLVVLNLLGMFPGYASFGWVADHIGRRKTFLVYSLMAALLIPFVRSEQIARSVARSRYPRLHSSELESSPALASWGAKMSNRRASRALGFTYNGARTMSSLAPFVIGRIGQSRGLSWAFYLRRQLSSRRPDDHTTAGDQGQRLGIGFSMSLVNRIDNHSVSTFRASFRQCTMTMAESTNTIPNVWVYQAFAQHSSCGVQD